MYGRYEPMVPRNGRTLEVGIAARISGCSGQKELSLKDQEDHALELARELFAGKINPYVVATKAKGERLDRPELALIEEMIRTKRLDLLICEDIGRLIRGADAVRICGIAVDHGTRVLAPNDGIDTNDPDWEKDVLEACKEHVGHNAHASRRIKFKLMNRFLKSGLATGRPIYGYIVPEGAKTYNEWRKDDSATAIYAEWFHRLRENANCSLLADWLTSLGIPTGPYARRKTWDGKMVRRVTANTILKGVVGRGHKHSIKHNESGRRIPVKNPKGAALREFPHLAHVDPIEFDAVNALLSSSNARCGRKPIDGKDPRSRVAKKRTRFPGQHARCYYCGRIMVWGGNGVTENLMCSGSREWRCWNAFGFNGARAAVRAMEAVTSVVYRLGGFDLQFRGLVKAAQASQNGGEARWSELNRAAAELARRKQNILDSLERLGTTPDLQERYRQIQSEEQNNAFERREWERLRGRKEALPASVADLRARLESTFRGLATDSPEFGALLARVVPEFHVYLVRLCDGGHPLPRARIRVDLAGIVPEARLVAGLDGLLTQTLTIDLFDRPPQRERIRAEAVELERRGVEQREIARKLSEAATQAAVFNALELDRRMKELGLVTPYEFLQTPPEDYPKLRRHKNSKYRFESLLDYQPPTL